MTPARTILLDGYNLALEKGTGVATYARNLSHEAHNLGFGVDVLYGKRASSSQDPLMREVSFFDGGDPRKKRSPGTRMSDAKRIVPKPFGHAAVEVPVTGSVVTRPQEAQLPYFDRILNANDLFHRANTAFEVWSWFSTVNLPARPDLAHWTYPLPVRVKGVPNIYTLHDIVPLRLPYTTLDNKRRYLNLLRTLVRTADHIVTVSECSKRDIVELLGVSPDRVTNTYQSVDIPAAHRDKTEEQVVREVEGVTGLGYRGYFLFWGSIEPKKNIGRMIEAYLASGSSVPLVIVGARAWKSEGETALIAGAEDDSPTKSLSPGQRDRIIQLSYLPFGLLISLIRGARAALFPSLYEGFGLPALEAMLLGTPVICANTASLPEVVGDAAFTIDPYDTAALAAAIRAVDGDADLREDLARRGKIQADRFSPAAYRERLQTMYRQFL